MAEPGPWLWCTLQVRAVTFLVQLCLFHSLTPGKHPTSCLRTKSQWKINTSGTLELMLLMILGEQVYSSSKQNTSYCCVRRTSLNTLATLPCCSVSTYHCFIACTAHKSTLTCSTHGRPLTDAWKCLDDDQFNSFLWTILGMQLLVWKWWLWEKTCFLKCGIVAEPLYIPWDSGAAFLQMVGDPILSLFSEHDREGGAPPRHLGSLLRMQIATL